MPIPTYYGDEICYVNGLALRPRRPLDVARYRLGRMGFLSSGAADGGEEYALKPSADSSHAAILRWLAQLPAGNVLDLGCSGGRLSERIRALGHRVVGVDAVELPGVRGRVDRFIRADLDGGLPAEVRREGPFDIVVAADVLEHLRKPGLVLDDAHEAMAANGSLIVSVPNFAHWYVRARTLLGILDYDQRGLLDRSHVRFFTRRSIERELRRARFRPVRSHTTGLPLDVLLAGDGRTRRILTTLNRAAPAMRPTLFGYQFVYHCEASPAPVPFDESIPVL